MLRLVWGIRVDGVNGVPIGVDGVIGLGWLRWLGWMGCLGWMGWMGWMGWLGLDRVAGLVGLDRVAGLVGLVGVNQVVTFLVSHFFEKIVRLKCDHTKSGGLFNAKSFLK